MPTEPTGVDAAISAVALVITFAALWKGIFWIVDWLEHPRAYHRPVVRVCVVNGKVGVVLRQDYDNASRQYWDPYYRGILRYDAGHISAASGRRVVVDPVFVFTLRSPEYYTRVYGCYVEEALFHVRRMPDDGLNPLAKAHQHIHGKPWDGQLVNW